MAPYSGGCPSVYCFSLSLKPPHWSEYSSIHPLSPHQYQLLLYLLLNNYIGTRSDLPILEQNNDKGPT